MIEWRLFLTIREERGRARAWSAGQVIKAMLRDSGWFASPTSAGRPGASEASVRRDFARLCRIGSRDARAWRVGAAPAPNLGSSRSTALATSSFDFSRGRETSPPKRAIAGRRRALRGRRKDHHQRRHDDVRDGRLLRERRLKVLTNSYPWRRRYPRQANAAWRCRGGEVYREQEADRLAVRGDAIFSTIRPAEVHERDRHRAARRHRSDPLIARAETKLLKRADKLICSQTVQSSSHAAASSSVRCPASPSSSPIAPRRLRRYEMLRESASRPYGRRRTGDRARRARSRLIDRPRRKQDHAASRDERRNRRKACSS